jgi:hypothetical protein
MRGLAGTGIALTLLRYFIFWSRKRIAFSFAATIAYRGKSAINLGNCRLKKFNKYGGTRKNQRERNVQEKHMSKKTRNWFIGGMILAVFVLGIPLAEQVIATASTPEVKKPATCTAHEGAPAMGGHPSVVAVGDNYLQILSTGNGSIGALLYDSSFNLLGVNENEAALTFALPDGAKKTVKITVPDLEKLGTKASDSSSCTSSQAGGMPDSCPIQAQDACPKEGAPAPTN